MNNGILFLIILYEVITVMIIYKLWTAKPRLAILERCLLTAVLFVPFFGWIMYLFLKTSPEAHGENPYCSGWTGDT